VQKVIVVGSCYEYGMVYGPVDVNHSTNPITPYGLAKKKLFERLRNLQLKNHFCLIWPRIFYIYGDDDDSGNIISQFDKAIKNGDEVFPMSHGEQILDYLHVSDVADKLIELIEYDDGVYNICSGRPISIRRLIEARKETKKSNLKLNIGYYPYRENESMAFWGIPNV
jgi:dTDP-6-deoxy-L-talose 4-dehydrogenase (NAD+)